MKTKLTAEIIEQNGKAPLLFEVEKDLIKITGDGTIKYSDLFEYMFRLATPEAQSQMIPVQQELGNEYMKQIRIKCKKDMKEGEELVVNVKVRVPELVEQQILKDLIDKTKEKE